MAVCKAVANLIVNQAYDNMGLASTQTLGAILDGIMRNIPEAHVFIERAAEQGVQLPSLNATAGSATTARPPTTASPTRTTSSTPSPKFPLIEWGLSG